MNTQIVAIILQEGGKFISELIRSRPLKRTVIKPVKEEPDYERIEEYPWEEPSYKRPTLAEVEERAGEIATACVPCAIGHLGTCVGGLNEAMRFAKKDGIESSEVIDRVNMCLDELNIMERIDLRPELTAELPGWEKELADKSLVESRNTRHNLEGLASVDDLERTAANLQTARNEIGREWFKYRLSTMSKEEKAEVAKEAISRLEAK